MFTPKLLNIMTKDKTLSTNQPADAIEADAEFADRIVSVGDPSSWMTLTGPMTPGEVHAALNEMIEVARNGG